MKKTSSVLHKITAAVLTLVMLCSFCLIGIPTASAAQVTRREKTYDIAVVYDNSGSMYIKNNKAWSQAKYAMEIFASMVDYNKDSLNIYPMHKVTTDGTSETGGTLGPISISNKNEIDKIHNMFTPSAGGTPYKPVIDAHQKLKTSTKKEKWLIVLTDGEFDDRSGSALANDLKALTGNGIKVFYIGLAGATKLTEDTNKGFYAMTSTNIMDDLIKVCNTIFQRSELKGSLQGDKLTLDLSMKKLIVFAQGTGAKINSLKDSTGKNVTVSLDSGTRTYSKRGCGNDSYKPNAYDDTLAGQVVTFESCPKGTYTLDCSGATKVQIFYEPDVDISVTMTNASGEEVDLSSGEITAGEYTVNYKLIDAVTGEDITKHKLLGDDVSIMAKFRKSTDPQGEYKKIINGGKITLTPDNATDFFVEGKYLDEYTISTKDTGTIPNPIIVLPEPPEPTEPPTEPPTTAPPVEFAVKIEPAQSWYKISDSENWQPIKIALTINGKPLTEEEFATAKLDEILFEKELLYKLVPAPEESAYYIHICKDVNNNDSFVKPETGVYKIHVKASMEHAERGTLTSEASDKFEIQLYDKIVRVIIVSSIILLIIALILFLLTRKAWPRKMQFVVDETHKRYSITPGKKMAIVPMGGAISVTAEKASQVRHMFGKKAKIRVSDVHVRNNVVGYSVNYVPYDNENPYKGIIRNSTAIEVVYDDGTTVTGKISVN